MAMVEPSRDSGEKMYRVFSEFIQNPRLSELSITRAGKVRLLSPSVRDSLLKRLFGNEDLDPATTLEVLHAVWLHYKTGGQELGVTNEKVRHLAGRLIDDLTPSVPRLEGPRADDLLSAIQMSLIKYVKMHRLPRQILIAQEVMMRWVLPLEDLRLEEDLPHLAHRLVICGTAALEKFRDLPLTSDESDDRFTSKQLAEVMEVLAHNMGEKLDLPDYRAKKDLTSSGELTEVLKTQVKDNTKTGRLLKALSSALRQVPEEHIREVLRTALNQERFPLHCQCRSIWVIVGLKKIDVRHTLRFQTDPEVVMPNQGFSFDCEFSLAFDREMRECRDVNLKVMAPQFGLNGSDAIACDVNEALRSHFPFSY